MHDIKYGKEPRNKLSGNNYLNILNNQISYKTNIVSFKNQYIETLFVQGRNLVPSRPAIGLEKVNKPCITNSRPARHRFLPEVTS